MNKTINKKQYDIPQQRRTTGLHDLFSVNIENGGVMLLECSSLSNDNLRRQWNNSTA